MQRSRQDLEKDVIKAASHTESEQKDSYEVGSFIQVPLIVMTYSVLAGFLSPLPDL